MNAKTPIQITAVGKSISTQNGIKLVGAMTYLMDIAVNSGMLSAEDLALMFDTVLTPGVQPPAGHPPGGHTDAENAAADEDLEQIEASGILEPIQASACCLLTTIEKRTWQNNLGTAMDVFRMRSRDVLFMSDDMLVRAKYPKDRATTLKGFVDDLISFLADAAKKYKDEYRDGGFMGELSFPMPMPMPMMMASKEAQVQAGRFTDSIERRTWNSRLDSTIDIFMSYFGDLVRFTDAEIDSMYQVKDRAAATNKILKELKTALVDIVESFPVSLRSVNDADRGKRVMQLSALDADTEKVVLEFGLQLAAADPSSLNRRPMEGMLFPIDTPSEATPAVGPGLPLFVPRSVAMGLLNRVSGLPLDADDSLNKHANKQIIGVMQAASIEGNEFRVNGFLYDWSNPELVALISANKQSLGMSMNAMAKGSAREIEGRKVFCVDSLELMGANILRSSKATFTGTNLISASAKDTETIELDSENADEIDFSSPDFDSIVGKLNDLVEAEDDDIDAEDLDNVLLELDAVQFDDDTATDEFELDDSIDPDLNNPADPLDPIPDTELQLSQPPIDMTDLEKLSQQIESFATNVNETMSQTVQAVAMLTADYNERQAIAQVQAAAQQQEDARYAAESIADLAIARMQASGLFDRQEVAAAAAPAATQIPARRTVAIAAAAGLPVAPESDERKTYELQLASIGGQLDVLESVPGSGEQMNVLIQQSQQIRAQMARLG